MNDSIHFAPDDADDISHESSWKLLIVDDEEDIHHVTKLVLKGFSYKNRGIQFLDAYSAAEAETIIREHFDVALVLLDVVMETDSSGLDLVNWIRMEMGLNDLRIILRTGQPGIAPERKVIDSYDIDGYATKNELTTEKLYAIVRNGLKNYSDIKRAEETQRELTLVETAATLRENLTSMIVHDLNNPLSILRSMFDMWKEQPVFAQEGSLKEQLKLSSRALKKLTEMVHEQLKLSQLESGRYELQHEPVDMNLLIEEIHSGSAHELKNLTFEYFAFPKNFPILILDRELLRRVIVNLFSNALRYTEEGMIGIRCQYNKKKELLVITITDTGIGIPKEDIPHLFDMYYQAGNRKRKSSNFGIGLSFCDFAVKAMGGEIKVESRVGKGTEFHISFPAKHSDEVCTPITRTGLGERTEPQPERKRTPIKQNSTHVKKDHVLKVLLVDDSNTIRRIMKMFLVETGITDIEEAHNGKIGLDKIQAGKYDVVFLDIMMPVMTGLELVERVKPLYPDLPIIMLTAEHLKQKEAEKLNVAAYITKPFTQMDIQTCLKSLKLI